MGIRHHHHHHKKTQQPKAHCGEPIDAIYHDNLSPKEKMQLITVICCVSLALCLSLFGLVVYQHHHHQQLILSHHQATNNSISFAPGYLRPSSSSPWPATDGIQFLGALMLSNANYSKCLHHQGAEYVGSLRPLLLRSDSCQQRDLTDSEEANPPKHIFYCALARSLNQGLLSFADVVRVDLHNDTTEWIAIETPLRAEWMNNYCVIMDGVAAWKSFRELTF